jgi:RNA polymerase sigma-70 factor (ECF subfamily)
VELAYFGGYTQVEIASIMNVPLGTVKSRMRLALERLRTILVERETSDLPTGG